MTPNHHAMMGLGVASGMGAVWLIARCYERKSID